MSVPALRFREFSGDWDLYPLKDRIDFLAGYAFDSKLMSAEKSIFQLIKMSNVYQGELSLDRNPAYWGELDNGTRKFLLKKGDVVLTLTGTVGKKDYGYSVDIPDDNKFLINQRLVRLREVSEKSTNKFIKYILLTERFYYQFFSDSKGGTGNQSNVSIEDLKKIHLYLPSLQEQTKIANFLTAVDEKISILTQKATLLSQYKKGVMQQIFSQELRFKDDDGQEFPEWEEKTLGEIGDIITGSTPDTKNQSFYNGDKLFISPADINSNRFITVTRTTLTDKGFEEGRKVKAGSILFVCIGSTIGKVAQNKTECITNQQINAVVPNDNYSSNFIYSLLEKNALKIALLAGKQAVPIINKTTFSKIKISIPSLPEQNKIANFLTAIDDKITNNQTQLKAVKQYKQGLLQQMFV